MAAPEMVPRSHHPLLPVEIGVSVSGIQAEFLGVNLRPSCTWQTFRDLFRSEGFQKLLAALTDVTSDE